MQDSDKDDDGEEEETESAKMREENESAVKRVKDKSALFNQPFSVSWSPDGKKLAVKPMKGWGLGKLAVKPSVRSGHTTGSLVYESAC